MSEKKFGSIKEKIWTKTKQTLLYVGFVVVGAALAIGVEHNIINSNGVGTIKWIKAGSMSVSLNEKQELMFIDRTLGKPFIVDSILTKIVAQKFASEKYLKTNKVY